MMKIKSSDFCLSKAQCFCAVEKRHWCGVHRRQCFRHRVPDTGLWLFYSSVLQNECLGFILFLFFLIIAPNTPSYISSWNHVCQCILFFVFFFFFWLLFVFIGYCLVGVCVCGCCYFFRLVCEVLGPSQHPCSHLPSCFILTGSLTASHTWVRLRTLLFPVCAFLTR